MLDSDKKALDQRKHSKFTIARKLPLVIVAAALISAVVVGAANYFSAAASIRSEAKASCPH